jgi:alkanesulfonate monooxygenase SsuD/methylene tetrahydromethanopterin reductase-like flavin-dependent oxidoreductase (luciferase family)
MLPDGDLTVRTGVWLYPAATVDELVEAVVVADRAGLDEVWIADEGVMRDPFVVFAAAAGRTTSVRMGIGITSPALRHPGAIAATAASLDELSDGRVMLGLGVGGEHSLEPFGLRLERPVAAMRDALRTARAVLSRSSGDGYVVPDHAAPARDVPLYIASRGEQINTLASREADGVFLSGFDPEQLPTVLGWARRVGSPTVALYQSVRFRPPASDDTASNDTTSVTGTPEELAELLGALAELHRPDTIGIALVDGDPVVDMVERAVETFDSLAFSSLG